VDIRCPGCKATLEVDERALIPPGRTIQCAACGHAFAHSETQTSAAEATTIPATMHAWHVRLTNRSQLQCPSDGELRSWIHRKVVTGDCMVSKDGERWQRLRDTALYREMETPTIDEPAGPAFEPPEVVGYRTDVQYRETEAATPPTPIILHSSADPSGFRPILLALLMVTCAVVGWWFGSFESRIISTLDEHMAASPVPPPSSQESATREPREEPSEASPDGEVDPEPSPLAPPDEPSQDPSAEPPTSASQTPPTAPEAPQPAKNPVDEPTLLATETDDSDSENAAENAALATDTTTRGDPPPSSPQKSQRSTRRAASKNHAHANLSHDARMKAGNAALQSGRLQEAAEHFEKASQQTASVEPIVKKGIAQMRMGKAEQAMRAFRSALQHNPDYRRTYIALAKALEKTGRSREAAHYYREYLQRFPDGSQAKQARRALTRLE